MGRAAFFLLSLLCGADDGNQIEFVILDRALQCDAAIYEDK